MLKTVMLLIIFEETEFFSRILEQKDQKNHIYFKYNYL